MGPEGDAQIVLGTIIEVNLVAYVQSQSDRAQEAFDTSAWIECKLGVAAGHPTQSALKAAAGILIRDAEVNKTNFAGHEHPEC